MRTKAPNRVSSARLPKGIAERETLECTKSFDAGFDVDSPGLIIVVAASGSWAAEGQLLPRPVEGEIVPHKIELLPPGGGPVAAELTSEGSESQLVYEIPSSVTTPGRWTVRLTNLATQTKEFGLFVSYPGTRELWTADISADAFTELADLHLEFNRGHQASRLELKTPAGPVTHFFTIETLEYSCPWMPRVLGSLDDVQSTSATVSIPDKTDPLLRYELGFEDEGVEINGTIPLHLSNMRLTVDLPVIVRYHKAAGSKMLETIDYDETGVRVNFSFEPQFAELVEWFPGFFPRWRRLIQRTVEDACRELFAAYELRQLFAEAIRAHVLQEIGQNAKPVGVTAADGKLRVSYYAM